MDNKFGPCHICNSHKFLLLRKTSEYNFGKCSNCGVFYINPLPKIKGEIAKKFYDDYQYNKEFIELHEEYKSLFQLSLRNKLEKIKLLLNRNLTNQPLRFLDIGCGGGGYVYAAQELGLEAHGIDIDKKSYLFAKSLGLNVLNSEIKDANYPDNYFDIIQIKQILEHIYYPKELLLEISRILNKNGVLIIDVPNQKGFIPKIKILLNLRKNEYGFLQPPRHLYVYTAKSLKYLLNQTGFQIINSSTSGPGDPVYYPIYKQKLLLKWVFKIASALNMGSILVVYAKKIK